MHLLSSDDVKQAKTETSRETSERIQTLNREEGMAVRKLNLAKKAWEDYQVASEQTMAQYTKEMQARKDDLRSEVESLEGRRREAMKPVKEIITQANKTLNAAEKRAIEVEQREFHVKQKEEEVMEKLEDLHDQADELRQAEAELAKRIEHQKDEVTRFSESQKKLADAWVEYHKAVHENNERLTERERHIATAKQTNEIFKIELAERKKAQDNRDRQITDRYRTLLKTEAEVKTGIRPPK